MIDLANLIDRAGLRVSWCGYCDRPTLAEKRCLVCGDCVYDDEPRLSADECMNPMCDRPAATTMMFFGRPVGRACATCASGMPTAREEAAPTPEG